MFDRFDFLAPIYDRAIPFSRLELMLKMVGLPVDSLLLDEGGDCFLQPGIVAVLRKSPASVRKSRINPTSCAPAQRRCVEFIETAFTH